MQKRTGNVNTATLTSRKLTDGAVKKPTDIEKLAKLGKAGLKGGTDDPVEGGAALKVLTDGQGLIKDGVLEDNAEITARSIGILVKIDAVDAHGTAVTGQLAAKNGYRRALPCTVDAEEGEELSTVNAERDIVHCDDITEGLAQIFYFNDSIQRSTSDM